MEISGLANWREKTLHALSGLALGSPLGPYAFRPRAASSSPSPRGPVPKRSPTSPASSACHAPVSARRSTSLPLRLLCAPVPPHVPLAGGVRRALAERREAPPGGKAPEDVG